jgi:hypothetical protein
VIVPLLLALLLRSSARRSVPLLIRVSSTTAITSGAPGAAGLMVKQDINGHYSLFTLQAKETTWHW